MGDATPLDSDGVGQKDLTSMVSRGLFSSIPMVKVTKPNLVILVTFFVVFRL